MQRCPLVLAEKIRDELGYVIWWHPQTEGEDADGLLTATKGLRFETNPRVKEMIPKGSISQKDKSQSTIYQRMVFRNCVYVNFLPPFRPKGSHIDYFIKLLKLDFDIAVGDTHLDLNHCNLKMPYNASPFFQPWTKIENSQANFSKPGEPKQVLTWIMSAGKSIQYEKVHWLGENHVGHHPVEAWFDEPKGDIPVVEIS